jgi:cobalt/nickel transport system permease protein
LSHGPLDARVRLSAAVGAWAIVLGAPHPATAAAVASLALALRLARPRPLRALLPALAFGLVAALLLAAFGSASGRWTPAAILFARIVAAGWVGSALVAWLPLSELLAALAWARVPPALLELVAIGDRQRHALADHALTVLHAQRLRLGWTGPRRALRSAGSLAGLAVWRAVTQAEIASDALALRGARGRLHYVLEPLPGWRNALFAAWAASALIGCLLLPGLAHP